MTFSPVVLRSAGKPATETRSARPQSTGLDPASFSTPTLNPPKQEPHYPRSGVIMVIKYSCSFVYIAKT